MASKRKQSPELASMERESSRAAATPRRRVVFLSGTRADFGKLKSLISVLRADPSAFDVHVFVTGMHLDPRYGLTVREFHKAGLPNLHCHPNHDQNGMDQALAATIQGFGQCVRELKPDLIVVHGDRPEALAGAIVGSLNNILVAHVEGGELSGTADGFIRHSVSKMSHIHLVSNQAARNRLLQLGEAPDAVHVIGSPDVDIMRASSLPRLEDVKQHYEIPFHHYGLLAMHPVTTELDLLPGHIAAVVEGALSSSLDWVVIYPNNDSGSQQILRHYRKHLYRNPRVRLYPSLRFEATLVLLEHARVILGNSSMGIREAPYYGTPTVNVGSRQHGRTENPHILHVPPDARSIASAIEKACKNTHLRPVCEWGEGDSHQRFHELLQSEGFWNTSLSKIFCDVSRNAARVPDQPLTQKQALVGS